MKEKNALVIGGTWWLWEEISNELKWNWFNVLTVGRTPWKWDFACDVGNTAEWKETLTEIDNSIESLDVLACIAWWVTMWIHTLTDLSIRDFAEVVSRNALYPFLAFNHVKGKLMESDNPKVITTWSRWTHRTDFPAELWSYAFSKRLLFMLMFTNALENPKVSYSNFCVPLMDTPMYQEWSAKFEQKTWKKVPAQELEDITKVAKTMIDKVLSSQTLPIPYRFTKYTWWNLWLIPVSCENIILMDELFLPYVKPYMDFINPIITARWEKPMQTVTEFSTRLIAVYLDSMDFFKKTWYLWLNIIAAILGSFAIIFKESS